MVGSYVSTKWFRHSCGLVSRCRVSGDAVRKGGWYLDRQGRLAHAAVAQHHQLVQRHLAGHGVGLGAVGGQLSSWSASGPAGCVVQAACHVVAGSVSASAQAGPRRVVPAAGASESIGRRRAQRRTAVGGRGRSRGRGRGGARVNGERVSTSGAGVGAGSRNSRGPGGAITYRQRLSGLGRIDAGDVGWRGCGVDGHDSGGDAMEERGQKKRQVR